MAGSRAIASSAMDDPTPPDQDLVDHIEVRLEELEKTFRDMVQTFIINHHHLQQKLSSINEVPTIGVENVKEAMQEQFREVRKAIHKKNMGGLHNRRGEVHGGHGTLEVAHERTGEADQRVRDESGRAHPGGGGVKEARHWRCTQRRKSVIPR